MQKNHISTERFLLYSKISQKQHWITIAKARIKRICLAQIVEQPPQPFGDEMFAVKWFAMHVVFISNCMVLIGRILCVVILSTHVEDDQRVTNQDAGVSLLEYPSKMTEILMYF